MLEKIIITIITPVYNREDCIGRCIESVQNQRFKNYEHIIVDDGSNDGTLNIIESFKSSHTNLKVINYVENKGVNFARNRGIEQAKGKFIIFLDSDDWLSEDALGQINYAIGEHPGYLHYLFRVSDRINDNSLPQTVKEFQYKDWLSGSISGDFAHVIEKVCFEGLLFVEELRIYEALSWTRVLRNNKKQLYIPKVIFQRERNRSDSLSHEYKLRSFTDLENSFKFLYQYIDWFYSDFIANNLRSKIKEHLRVAFLLGVASDNFKRNETLLTKMNSLGLHVFFYSKLNVKFFSSIIRSLIFIKSRLKVSLL